MSAAVDIQHVHILGAGRMGQGIALAFAYAGLRVTLIDFKERDPAARSAFAAAARGEIVRQLKTLVVLGLCNRIADNLLSPAHQGLEAFAHLWVSALGQELDQQPGPFLVLATEVHQLFEHGGQCGNRIVCLGKAADSAG